MAKKGDPDNKGASQRAKYQKQADFVRYELSDDEAKNLKTAEVSEKAALEGVVALVEQEYKLTMRWDGYHGCHCVWLLPPDNHPDNAGLILTGRGSSPFKALKQLLWLHYERFKEIWPAPMTKAQVDIDD